MRFVTAWPFSIRPLTRRSGGCQPMMHFTKDVVIARSKSLTVCTGALVSRIGFSVDRSLQRAEKVHFRHAKSKSERDSSVKAKKEVIVCGGAISSPQILMMRCVILLVFGSTILLPKRCLLAVFSGIGPRQHLEQHNIQVVRDLPGVGSQLVPLL